MVACKVPGEITRVQTVPTGYAISATDEGTAFLLSTQAKELAGDGYFEAATEYHQVVVSRIPQRIWNPDSGWMPTTISDISAEAERVTGQKPLTTRLSNHQIEADSVTAVIAFPKKPRYALQLFGASGLSRPTRPKQRPLQCTRCHSFHDTRACRSSERCVSCGSSKPEHTCRAQCINCHGPHAADYPKCPARPYTQKGAIVRLSKAALTAANVGRGGPAHDLLLSYEADVILVQEPWTDMTRQLTKTHPRYQLFGPTTRWEARPRALTYVRRDLPAFPLPPPRFTRYRSSLRIRTHNNQHLPPPPKDLVVPNTSSSTPSTLHTLLQYSPPQNTILAGDFNTHHPLWQPETEAHNTTPGATALIEWLEANGLALCIEPGTPTRGPNTIDLVFSDIPVEATAEDHLSSTSDHATILITIDWQEPPPRRKLGSTDWEKAKILLNLPHKDLPVDDIAEKLVNTVQGAIRGASKYNTRGLPRTPWWTPELTDLLRKTRQQQVPDYLSLRRAISRAKASSWKERIEQATLPTDAFTLARLHRRADQLSAPPLHIRNERITTPQGKADTFLTHLLEKGTSFPHQQEEGPPTQPRDLGGESLPAEEGGLVTTTGRMGRGPYFLDTRLAIRPLRVGPGRRRYRHRKAQRRPPTGVPPYPPVLFLLYAAKIVSSQDNSFCYADDLGLLFVGDSLEETSQQLVEVYKTITLSGAASGLPFSPEKTEIQHFSKQRKLSAPTVTLPGQAHLPATYQLGLQPGKRLALHLRKLSNTQRGCPVSSMRAAVIQCVIPTALYGAEVFYTGRGQKGLIDSLRSLLRLAALAILPAYRTTPTSALLREADLPYPEALLDGVLQKAAVRYASLDVRHPIARVTISAYDPRGTRLTKILQRVPTPAPERVRIESRLPPLRILPTTDTNKAVYSLAPLRLTVYSDGLPGSQTEVYDAELMGAVEGLQAAVNLPCVSYSAGLVIFLDNLAVASLLADGRPALHRRKLTNLFQKLTTQWKSAPYILSTPRTPVEVRWMPGHSGIAGNETADELAKRGAALDGSYIPPSLSYLMREAKQHTRAATCTAYTRDAPQAYQDLNIQPYTKNSRAREHRLPRGVLGRLLAVRTGHGDFQAYHERFYHRDSLTTCSCGKPKSPVHFFFCPPARKRWKDRWKGPKVSPSAMIDWILSTAAGAEEFGRFVQETSFFKDICPNRAQTCAA
ncbi:hypothetical protein N7509_008207 [Penicillium cosmopolitanum]|uniref:RNase H type-1 domain-containing protein n=1 Tax=Penicillium cosmopolitanum TaxID=1131564 RepID=A0A9W9VM50_9EURO|nr:uncharacterized protein N7509_008207 [Penicillium cosmopolitanum]KAJ5385666.1 hypothetical protein N7509_008207 [Penicillium cosmopolitanum]